MKKKVVRSPLTNKILEMSNRGVCYNEIANILHVSMIKVMDVVQRDFAYQQMYGK